MATAAAQPNTESDKYDSIEYPQVKFVYSS